MNKKSNHKRSGRPPPAEFPPAGGNAKSCQEHFRQLAETLKSASDISASWRKRQILPETFPPAGGNAKKRQRHFRQLAETPKNASSISASWRKKRKNV